MNRLFISICILFTITSCKKEEPETATSTSCTEITPDYSHLSGNFLFEVTNQSLYQQSSLHHKDYVYDLYVSQDTLRFKNLNLPFFLVTSDTQTVFYYSNTTQFENVNATLVYSNNYDNVEYEYYSNSLASGPDTDKSYSGARTSLSETTTPHPFLNEIEGEYLMQVTKKDFWTGQDTVYWDTLSIELSGGMTFNLDSTSYSMYPAHSYSNFKYEDWSSSETVSIKNWNRTEDSLHIEVLDYVGTWSTPHDSVHTVYSGAKL